MDNIEDYLTRDEQETLLKFSSRWAYIPGLTFGRGRINVGDYRDPSGIESFY